jgi:hypothetical protein
MLRSAEGLIVSVSIAELFPGVGSVTPPGAAIEAVLTRFPLADEPNVATTVYVTFFPEGIDTLSA